MSFRIKFSGTWRSACELFLGDAAGVLFDEGERGREVIVMRASSSCWQDQRTQRLRYRLPALRP
jgi:hypothetical protein